ncbi:MAG: hypothetical protein M5R36_09265 [Deltaproteobacteria bacterium]|nr:hypothetical protein [Deltaproteobacteria bacterium]
MAILATVLVVLLQNHSMSIRLSQRARLTSIAANLARDLVTEIEVQGFPEVGSDAGDFSDLFPGLYAGFTWEKEVNESIFADFIREVVVRVTYIENGVPQTVEIMTMMSAMDADEQQLATDTYGTGDLSPAESALVGQYGRSGGGGEQ